MKTKQMSKTRKKILIIGEMNYPIEQRLSSILSRESITKEYYFLSDFKPIPVFFVRWVLVVKKLNKLLKTFNPDKVLVTSGPLVPVWLIFPLIKFLRLKTEVILLRYDIEHFRPYSRGFKTTVGHYVARKLEKFCLIMADKIMHKGLENELQYLPFYEKIKDKPHYLFREFLDPDLIQKYDSKKKLSAKDGETHLVYVGGLILKDVPHTDSFWKIYPKITKQGIHLHIYSKLPKEIVNKFKQIEKKDKYFHYGGYLEHNKLIDEMSKYDYGIHVHGTGKSPKKSDVWFKIAFANKYYDYALAYLPIICSKSLKAASELIEKNKIGFPIEYSKIENLKKEILKNNENYHLYIKNIKKFIKNRTNDELLINFMNE